jgi:hypothetical protein
MWGPADTIMAVNGVNCRRLLRVVALHVGPTAIVGHNIIFDCLQPTDTCAPNISLKPSKIIYVRVRESKSNAVGFTVVPYEAR